MSETRQHSKPTGTSRWRVIVARVLTVVAILLALVGMVAFYVEHTALDDEGFETISRNMIENDEIRTQVAGKSVETLFGNVDVEAAIAERLPPAQKGLAPVLAGLARSGADRAADAVLERPRVQTVWVEVTTRAQRQFVRLLDDDTTFIQTEGGAVVLDLRPLVIELGDQVAVIGKVAERLPESAGRVAIIEESQLETAQTATKVLRAVADWMWLVALAVAALAIWLARGRRRLELRAIAIGLVVVGLLLLAVRRFAGDYLVDELAKDDAVKPAATMPGASSRRFSPTAPGCGSSSASSRSSASGSWVTPAGQPRRAMQRTRSSRTAWRPMRSPQARCSCSLWSLPPSPPAG